MSILKITGIIVISIVVLAILAISVIIFFYQPISPNSIAIETLSVSEDNVTIKGADVMDSAGIAYRWHFVEYDNEILYIKIIGGLHFGVSLPFFNYQETTGFNISIPNKYGKIKQIYLQGDNLSENVLIWPKK